MAQSKRIPAAARRQALIEAALRVVAERGVSAATTRAIVTEAGMSLASFHYAFSSQHELMTELVGHIFGHESRALQPAYTAAVGGLSMRDVLRRGLQHYFDYLREDPLREKAMLELTQYALRAEDMAPLAREQYQRYYELGTSALTVAAEQTEHSWTRPIADVATLLITLTDGLTIAWLVNRDDRAAQAILDFAADSVAALAVPISKVEAA